MVQSQQKINKKAHHFKTTPKTPKEISLENHYFEKINRFVC
jgi:hypothetical protein